MALLVWDRHRQRKPSGYTEGLRHAESENPFQRLAAVEAPLNAAAYELELNVNGAGLAVLKYLATRRREYREQDFSVLIR